MLTLLGVQPAAIRINAGVRSEKRGETVRAPISSLYVRFPEDFGRRLVVFVDTEEEFDWSKPKRRDSTSVRAVQALPKAHRTLRGYGLKPAYLVDFPVTVTEASANVLRGFLAADECTIGTQLHPWVNPPFDETLDAVNSFVGNLPRNLERAKLKALTDAITESFGMRPIVYRAGRYGIGPNTEALLDELGYRMDTSVRPFFDYRDEGGPSFRRIEPQPYWTGPEKRLLEVPLTSTFVGGLRRLGEPLFHFGGRIPHMRGLMARTGLLSRVPLTPEGTSLQEALAALSVLLDSDMQLFSISFHSPSVEPGHTPYVRDSADLKRFYAWLDGVFNFLAKAGVTPATVDDVLDAAERSKGEQRKAA